MTGFNHGMTGAVIALVVKEPLIAIPASFASHFICDAIPHFGVPAEKLFKRAFNLTLLGDFLFAVTLMIILGAWFPAERWLIWTCMIAAAIPDIESAYYALYQAHIKGRPFKSLKFDPLYRFHLWVQWSETYPGAITEVIWFVLMSTIVVTIK